MDNQKVIQLFREIRDIPYRIPLSAQETDQCCTGKHLILKSKLAELGYGVRFRVCSYKWSAMLLPSDLLAIPHEDDSTHVYLEVKINDKWLPIDATWDSAISSILPSNDWDGISPTPIAVPVIDLFTPEDSHRIMFEGTEQETAFDLEKNGLFYKAFNDWLEQIRHQQGTSQIKDD